MLHVISHIAFDLVGPIVGSIDDKEKTLREAIPNIDEIMCDPVRRLTHDTISISSYKRYATATLSAILMTAIILAVYELASYLGESALFERPASTTVELLIIIIGFLGSLS